MNPDAMTPIGYLSATGTGEVRDADGNLLDRSGHIVTPQNEKDENSW